MVEPELTLDILDRLPRLVGGESLDLGPEDRICVSPSSEPIYSCFAIRITSEKPPSVRS